ncbi:MAG: DNA translocase FtsK 4TM domain-containing protein [Thermodesulfobacteriaceae bacterium]|nr:DNA translocase FtsK 4TM domain-containing protein [Thermodesulfobacteriaceae bacterium]MCX8042281.1 DNA translocase FtsK 4TM domain-containing protein [Thermodesulfobacteriaceae bacterium]MDW8136718.1 DNA translocase FtsK 4TM domain-containing protein [Thermodesulfobacterium sp.]
MISEKLLNKKALLFCFFLFFIFLTLSLYSYSPYDPGINIKGTSEIRNWGGLIGAFLSSIFYFLFGFTTLLIPIFLFLALLLISLGLSIKKTILVFSILIFVFSSTFSYFFYFLEVDIFYLFNKYPLHGGLIGELSLLLIPVVGTSGFFFLILGFFLLALFVGFGSLQFITHLSSTFLFRNKSKETQPKSLETDLEEERKKEKKKNLEELPVKIKIPSEGKILEIEEEIRENIKLEESKTEFERELKKGFQPPSLNLLDDPLPSSYKVRPEELRERALILISKLKEFGIEGEVVSISPGPVITVFEFKPAPGIKISKILSLVDDLALGLSAKSVRIVAPIPGKNVIGIEISNPQREWVYLKEILESQAFKKAESPLTIALGKDLSGSPVVTDLMKMPHLLIAGSTGSGKSIFLHSVILSLIYKSNPEQVRFLMIDPKRIELSVYEGIPYLLHPVVLEPKTATKALHWAVSEMERRYSLFEEVSARNLDSYNEHFEEKLPYIVLIIDELADLMVVSSKEVETLLTRLAQMARAAGIHLLVATQRPSVDVITGLIKANFPARISFQVTSKVDSRTILDTQGAERLLGAGDMLFLPPGSSSLKRIHAPYVSEKEVKRVVEYLKKLGEPEYLTDLNTYSEDMEESDLEKGDSEEDKLYEEALKIAYQYGKISVSMLQRKLRIGYNRAARLVEKMEKEGIVGQSDGVRPRPVLGTSKRLFES